MIEIFLPNVYIKKTSFEYNAQLVESTLAIIDENRSRLWVFVIKSELTKIGIENKDVTV